MGGRTQEREGGIGGGSQRREVGISGVGGRGKGKRQTACLNNYKI